jgi:hypothetical protein
MSHPADDEEVVGIDRFRDRKRREHCPTCKATTPQFVNTVYINITVGMRIALSYICLLCGDIIDCDNAVANEHRGK